ncbi:MAG: glutathione S-transferase, partial [Mesorhizobium sp.]
MAKAAKAVAARPESATKATLTISSKNYSSWSLRGWLLC